MKMFRKSNQIKYSLNNKNKCEWCHRFEMGLQIICEWSEQNKIGWVVVRKDVALNWSKMHSQNVKLKLDFVYWEDSLYVVPPVQILERTHSTHPSRITAHGWFDSNLSHIKFSPMLHSINEVMTNDGMGAIGNFLRRKRLMQVKTVNSISLPSLLKNGERHKIP